MSKRDKLLEQLFAQPTPTDYRWDDLCTLLKGLGFDELQGKGSRVKFYSPAHDCVIIAHTPHPGKIIKPYLVRQVAKTLASVGIKP